MTEKEQKKIDDVINYFNNYSFDRVKKIREVININPHFDKNQEIETIKHLYKAVLQERKKNIKSTFFFASTSGWTVTYYRNKKKYKEDEDFEIEVHHSFVDYNTNE